MRSVLVLLVLDFFVKLRYYNGSLKIAGGRDKRDRSQLIHTVKSVGNATNYGDNRTLLCLLNIVVRYIRAGAW